MFKNSTHSKPFILARSLIVSYILTGILLLGLAFLMYKCTLNDKQVTLGVNAIYMVACLLGGLLCAKACGSRRLMWGVIAGLLYFIILFGLSLLFHQQVQQGMSHFFLVLTLCVLGGALGGVVS
jgi:putative membrane protein (TIGR04086 family)